MRRLTKNQQKDYAPSEDSDQPGHPPSLTRVFAVRMKKARSLATQWEHNKDSDQADLSHRWAHGEAAQIGLSFPCTENMKTTSKSMRLNIKP